MKIVENFHIYSQERQLNAPPCNFFTIAKNISFIRNPLGTSGANKTKIRRQCLVRKVNSSRGQASFLLSHSNVNFSRSHISSNFNVGIIMDLQILCLDLHC